AAAIKRQAWISASVKSTEVAKSQSAARCGPPHRGKFVYSVRRGGRFCRGIGQHSRCRDGRGSSSDTSASQTAGPAAPASDSRNNVNRRDGLGFAVLLSEEAGRRQHAFNAILLR